MNQEYQAIRDLRDEMVNPVLVEIRETQVLRVRQAPMVHKESRARLVNQEISETKDFQEFQEGVVQLVIRVAKDQLVTRVPTANQVSLQIEPRLSRKRRRYPNFRFGSQQPFVRSALPA